MTRPTTAPPTGSTDLIGIVEEELTTQDMIEHIANHCRIHLALHGIREEQEADPDKEATVCLARLDELNPH